MCALGTRRVFSRKENESAIDVLMKRAYKIFFLMDWMERSSRKERELNTSYSEDKKGEGDRPKVFCSKVKRGVSFFSHSDERISREMMIVVCTQ